MTAPSADAAAIYEDRSVVVDDGGRLATFRYRLLRPPRRRAGERHPVLLFLHGAGERGSDNAAQLRFLPRWMAEPAMRETFPCLLVAPQCRADHRWVDVDWRDAQSSRQAAATLDLIAAIAAVDEVLATEAADPDRLMVTGLSMGGFGTWDLSARIPERLAASLPICGGGDEATAGRFASLPLWCFHGVDDDVVPVVRSRTMVAALRAAGGSPAYTELHGVGHDAWTAAYRDPAVLDWLFSQRRR